MKIATASLFLIINFVFYSQDTLTLQNCIDLAKNNKLPLVTQYKDLKLSELNIKFNKWSLLPSLSAYTNLNSSFGRRVDPFTNTFATSNVNSQSMGLSTNVPIFSGFRYLYTSRLFEIEKKKNQLRYESNANQNLSKVIERFIEACKIQFQIELFEQKLNSLEQLQLIQKELFQEGKISSLDTLRSYNSMIKEKNALLELNNNFKNAQIALNFLIGLPLSSFHYLNSNDLDLFKVEITWNEENLISEIKLEISKLKEQIGVSRSNILPSLSLSGSIGSGFSTNNKDFSLPGNPVKPYSEQINQNLYEAIGINISIPIFNKGDYLKVQKMKDLEKEELLGRISLLEIEKEKRNLLREQQFIFFKSELEIIDQLIESNQMIYDNTLSIYKEGKIPYRDVEIAFFDLQSLHTEKMIKELDFILYQLIN